MGNNISATLMWLEIAVQHTSDAIRHDYVNFDLRNVRLLLCKYTLKLSFKSFKCYFYFLREVFSYLLVLPFLVMALILSMYQNADQEEMTLSAETGLTEQKYHFIWSQFTTVHTPNFVEQWINAAIFVAPFVGALLYLCCVCWCLWYCYRCCCICTRSRAIITVIIVIVLISIDWL